MRENRIKKKLHEGHPVTVISGLHNTDMIDFLGQFHGLPADAFSEEASEELRRVATPGKRSVEDVSSYLEIPANRFIKTLVFVQENGEPVAALVRGDQTLSEAKLRSALGTAEGPGDATDTVEVTARTAVGDIHIRRA